MPDLFIYLFLFIALSMAMLFQYLHISFHVQSKPHSYFPFFFGLGISKVMIDF